MTFDPRKSLELRRLDDYLEVATSVRCTGVAGMQVALIFHLQEVWLKRIPQSGFNRGNAFGCHGSALLKGLIVTLL